MAEFQEVMRQYKRMCEGFPVCGEACPLYATLGICVGQDFLKNNSEEFEQVVMKWAAEHPVKTMKEELLEKFPKAQLGDNGEPETCAEFLGYGPCPKRQDLHMNCLKCWNRLAPEGY